LSQHCSALQRLRHRRAIRPSHVPMITMYAPKQLADARLEIGVTARTTPAARRAEICPRRIAERAAHTARHGRRLVLEKFAEWMLRRRDGCLDTAIGSAPLTQMQLGNGVVFDGRQMHDGITLTTDPAQHQGTASRMSVSVRWPSSSKSVWSARAAS